jgi:hypothetical protein
MIPSGYKEDIVYSPVPTDGSGDLSFTRASNGTRVNSAGLVEVTPWNLFTYSEDFSNAIWVKSNATITANSTTAPNGTTTADTLTTTSISQCHTRQSYSFQIGVYTLSFYVKKVDLGFSYIEFGNAYCWVNLTTGAITGASQFGTGWTFVSASASSVGDGWFRVEFVASCSIAGTYSARPLQPVASAGTYDSGALNQTTFIWGAQVVEGSSAKPYFPTTDRLNVPRLTYQNGGGGCPSLLLEPQRTNLALWSNDFTNVVWSKSGATVTANTTISPDGTQNASTVVFTAGSQFVSQACITIGTNVTVSGWLKGTAGETKQIANGGLDTVVTLTGSWQRFEINRAITTGTNFNINTFGSATARTIYVYGFQAEVGSYATTYIPTTTASATRVVDFGSSPLSTTNANWTIYVDTYFKPYEEILNLLINTSTSRFVGFYESFNFFRLVGNAGAGIFAGRTMSNTEGRQKVVLQNDGTDCIVFVNGVKLGGINTSGASPLTGTASFQFQFYGGGTGVANKGRENELVQFDSKLSDADCIALSTL